MTVKLTWNGNLENEIQKLVQEELNSIASDYQRMFDSILARYQGRPVSEIEPVIRREWSRRGGSLSSAEATEYATAISEGTRIVVSA